MSDEQPVATVASIPYTDFEKVDIRLGQIESAEAVPKSKKLVKMTVFFGDELGRRTILAGVAEGMDGAPESLRNAYHLFIVNLEPRTMMGIESHGMMLCATDGGGRIHPATCGPPHMPGAKVR